MEAGPNGPQRNAECRSNLGLLELAPGQQQKDFAVGWLQRGQRLGQTRPDRRRVRRRDSLM